MVTRRRKRRKSAPRLMLFDWKAMTPLVLAALGAVSGGKATLDSRQAAGLSGQVASAQIIGMSELSEYQAQLRHDLDSLEAQVRLLRAVVAAQGRREGPQRVKAWKLDLPPDTLWVPQKKSLLRRLWPW